MIATKKQIDEMEQLAKPLVKFLCDNFQPHVSIVVMPSGVHLHEEVVGVTVTEFIKD